MTRSVMVSQGRRELLGRERHYAPAGIDVHVELVEEIAPEEAIAYIRGGQIVGAHWHASDAGVADLEAVDDHELDLFASRRAHDLARCRWGPCRFHGERGAGPCGRPSGRSGPLRAPVARARAERPRKAALLVARRDHTAHRARRYTTISAAPATSLRSRRTR